MRTATVTPQLPAIKAPNTFLIILGILLLVTALTWVIPGGAFEREVVEGREVVDPDSFEYVERRPQGPGAFFMAPIRGFVDAALIIGFVLIVGGAFGIFQATGAVDGLVRWAAALQARREGMRFVTIPLLMALFSLFGALFGMSEETIPLVLVFIPLALAMRYDTITGVAIPYVGAHVGFAAAFVNPFTLGVAQGIAELPPGSGWEYRIFAWVVFTAVAILFVTLYAERVRKNPRLSPTFEDDEEKRAKLDLDEIHRHARLAGRHLAALAIFGLAIVALMVGVQRYGWYIEEIAALFFAASLAIGLVGGLSVKSIVGSFTDGARALLGTALIIGLARGILVVAQDGRIIDTILFWLSSAVSGLPAIVSAQVMFLVQTVINFFVPSGSGQAALTMPIMAPLADLLGVSRQTAVLAYQFGDGFSNMILPTAPVLLGVLAVSGIPWERWARWILPLQAIFLVLALLLLVPPFFIGW